MTERDQSLRNLDTLGKELKVSLQQSVDDGIRNEIFKAKVREVDSGSTSIKILDQAALQSPSVLEREQWQAAAGFSKIIE